MFSCIRVLVVIFGEQSQMRETCFVPIKAIVESLHFNLLLRNGTTRYFPVRLIKPDVVTNLVYCTPSNFNTFLRYK